jgi:hypothetical protein
MLLKDLEEKTRTWQSALPKLKLTKGGSRSKNERIAKQGAEAGGLDAGLGARSAGKVNSDSEDLDKSSDLRSRKARPGRVRERL